MRYDALPKLNNAKLSSVNRRDKGRLGRGATGVPPPAPNLRYGYLHNPIQLLCLFRHSCRYERMGDTVVLQQRANNRKNCGSSTAGMKLCNHKPSRRLFLHCAYPLPFFELSSLIFPPIPVTWTRPGSAHSRLASEKEK